MRTWFLLVLLLILPTTVATGEPAAADRTCLAAVAALGNAPEQRGCCSWHGGVCGCSLGRIVCCDGALSPTCTCKGPDSRTGDASAERFLVNENVLADY